MNKWNKSRKEIDKFFKLSNSQWIKIIFSYNSFHKVWFETIVVADTKRKCNDCVRKTEFSPKVKYGQATGKRIGIEPFKIALKELLKFEKTIHNTQINIVAASDRLLNIYKYLKRYGYIEYEYLYNGKPRKILYKKIK
jgi:hypothetical protein